MKKLLSVAVCLALLLTVVPGIVNAEEESLFSNRDLLQEPDLTDAEKITLAGQIVTIDHAGVFLLSGSIENGQIAVAAGDEDKVQLVLDGVNIHSDLGPAIEVTNADKVFITLALGSENSLSSDAFSEDGGNGVIYSKADLTLNGSGQLTVTAQQGHGIVCKDTLAITGGSYTIQASGHGISGKDALNIGEGTFAITTGGGSTAVQMKASDNFGQRGRGWETVSGQEEEDTVKAKGLKSDGPITVLAGSFTLDCADDAVHAGGDVNISAGTWTIRTADDGVHSDENVTIAGGEFEIPYCYEGIEGKNVTISDGIFNITSNDDGINATGEDSSTGFRVPGMDTGAVITVDGGELTVVSDGDCLDSNGTIILNGGKLNLTCSGNGNTALDSESGITNNGAEVTTNDGSENGGGMRGAFGGKGQTGRGQFDGQNNGPFPENGKFSENGDFPGNGQRPQNGQGRPLENGQPDGASQATPPAANGCPCDPCPGENCDCSCQNVG